MKKFLAILMCGILLMSMVACTSNNDNSNPVTPNGDETTVSPETPTDPTDTTTSTNPPETTNPTDDNNDVEGDNTQNNETENGDSDNNDLPPENNDNTSDNGNDNEGGNDTDNKDDENGTVDNNGNENTNDSTDNNDDANNDNNNDDNDDNNDGDGNNTDDTEDDKVVDPNAPHTPTAIEQQILDLINAEREKAGLAPLTYNADIYECAVIRANEALEVWSHTRPDGTKYWTVYEECGKKITNCCGENLAKTFKDPVQIVQMLMESEGHRKNILYEDFKSVCIVVLVDERGYYYMSQCFMG